MDANNFFQDLANTKPFVKIAFQGFAGSGKTYTATELAINLHRLIGSKKPIVCYDTEKALKALKPRFDQAGISVKTKESRTLKDLETTIDLCHQGFADILVIDSISHVWENFLEAYRQQKKRSFLQFQDWGVIKPLWKLKFSDKFVTANVHIIFTGRAGYEYDDIVEEDDNGRKRREIAKSGIKMKAENETAYEPDLLVLMERHEDVLSEKKMVWREATVIKDRTTLIDGKTFRNPTFADFEPFVLQILDGSIVEQKPANEQELNFGDYEHKLNGNKKQCEIILDKVKSYFELMKIGTGKEEKALKIKILVSAFGTPSWQEIEGMKLQDLVSGLAWIELYKEAYMNYVKECADTGMNFSLDRCEELINDTEQLANII